MKRIILLGLLLVFLAPMVFAQEKVEAPIWNVGDKWIFIGNWNVEVIKADQRGYVLKYSDGSCVFESQGCNTILFEKSTRNRLNAIEGDKLKKYTMGLSKVLDFPLSSGKQWKYTYSGKSFVGGGMHQTAYDYSENYKVLGWEDAEVRAGKFKAVRLEYKRVVTGTSGWGVMGEEIINQYWYSPDVKNIVKHQFEDGPLWTRSEDSELTLFELKK